MFWGQFACEFRFQISQWALDKLMSFKFWASHVGPNGQGSGPQFSRMQNGSGSGKDVQRGGGGERMIKQMGQNIKNQCLRVKV